MRVRTNNMVSTSTLFKRAARAFVCARHSKSNKETFPMVGVRQKLLLPTENLPPRRSPTQRTARHWYVRCSDHTLDSALHVSCPTLNVYRVCSANFHPSVALTSELRVPNSAVRSAHFKKNSNMWYRLKVVRMIEAERHVTDSIFDLDLTTDSNAVVKVGIRVFTILLCHSKRWFLASRTVKSCA